MTYWDTEAYCLPFYMATAGPQVARELLVYRYNQLDKAIENLEERIARPFGVKVGGRIMRVLPADIEFVESDRRKVRIHLADQVIEAYESLGGISRKLPGTFVQCHKSFLVNMEKIAEMRSDQIDLLSGATIPISQKRSRPTREAFMDFLKERL